MEKNEEEVKENMYTLFEAKGYSLKNPFDSICHEKNRKHHNTSGVVFLNCVFVTVKGKINTKKMDVEKLSTSRTGYIKVDKMIR